MLNRTPQPVLWLTALLLAAGLSTMLGCSDDDSGSNCGDLIVDEGEQCDDGNSIDGDGCSSECLLEAFCGNGVVEIGEECDDGNDRGGDGCNSICQLEVGCGNGHLDYGEECDDGNINDDDECDSHCVDLDGMAICGNGYLEVGEDCDDGNTTDGDGCEHDCSVSTGCGDGELDPGEECDDDNVMSGDGCSWSCLLEFVCGDGVCDTENVETCAKCPADCCPYCGDGVLDTWSEGEDDPPPYADEECDDGNNVNGDGCNSGCEDEDGYPTCGNGILEAGEECDDGNTDNGDACSSTCTWEFVCGDNFCDVGNGESCRLCLQDCCPNCGNNMLDAGEMCDGNALNGQTCEDHCYDGGTLGCTAWCDFDVSQCTGTGPICGDDTAECDEQCDNTDLRGHTCDSLGHDGGSLSCNADCTYNLTSCGDLLVYLGEDFENPTSVQQWTLGGDWQHGQPTGYTSGSTVEPSSAHGGFSCIGTIFGATYSGSNSWTVDLAASPSINLQAAYTPTLRFYMWVNTESGWDCGALFINSGSGFQHVPTAQVSVAYNGNEGGYDCWQGTANTWQEVTVDLTSYVGSSVQVGFGFYSDSYANYAGFYIDDVYVAEPAALP